MTESPTHGPVIEVRAQPNVYTILLLVAVIALAVAVGACLWKLTSPPPVGYGMEIKQFFDPIMPAPR